MNFLPPAFSGSFPDCHGEEPRVVIASFQAQFGLFFGIVLNLLKRRSCFVILHVVLVSSEMSFLEFRCYKGLLFLNMFLILERITVKSCLLWTLLSDLITMLTSLVILLKSMLLLVCVITINISSVLDFWFMK